MSKEGDNAKVWSCVSYHGIGTLCFKEGTIHAKKYIKFIDNTLGQWQHNVSEITLYLKGDNTLVHTANALKKTTEKPNKQIKPNDLHSLLT